MTKLLNVPNGHPKEVSHNVPQIKTARITEQGKAYSIQQLLVKFANGEQMPVERAMHYGDASMYGTHTEKLEIMQASIDATNKAVKLAEDDRIKASKKEAEKAAKLEKELKEKAAADAAAFAQFQEFIKQSKTN